MGTVQMKVQVNTKTAQKRKPDLFAPGKKKSSLQTIKMGRGEVGSGSKAKCCSSLTSLTIFLHILHTLLYYYMQTWHLNCKNRKENIESLTVLLQKSHIHTMPTSYLILKHLCSLKCQTMKATVYVSNLNAGKQCAVYFIIVQKSLYQ